MPYDFDDGWHRWREERDTTGYYEPKTPAELERDAAIMETRRALLDDIREGLLVFRKRDGIPIADDLIEERALNILTGLLGNYSIQKLPAIVTAHWPMPKVKTKPVGHLSSCECGGCK